MAMNLDAMLRIKADVDGQNKIVALNRGLQQVGTTAAGVTGAMRGLTGAAAGLSGALGTLAPLLSAAGLVGMVKGTLDAADNMNDLSQATGVSVEALSRFNKAAAMSGTTIEGVGKGLVKLNKTMVDAATGGKASTATFQALGISVKNADGSLKSADRVMLEVANRFKAMPDGAAKTALALRLFGKSGAELVPLLNMGGDAIDKMSTRMTTAFAQKADEYNDKLATLGGKVRALGMDLTIALLPALDQITDALTVAVTAFNQLPAPLKSAAVGAATLAIAWEPLTGALKGGIGLLASAANGLEIFRYQAALAGGVMPMLIGNIKGLSAAILAIPGWGWALAGVAALGLLSKALYDNNEGFRNWVNNVGRVIAGDFANAMSNMKALAAGAIKGVSSAWQWLVGATRNAATAIGNVFSGPFGFISNAASKVFGSVQKAIAGLWNALPEPIRKALGQAGKMAINVVTATPIGYLASVGVRASQMGPQQTVNRTGKGDLPAGLAGGFTPDLTALESGGGSGAKKGANDAKQALNDYNNALRTAADLLQNVTRKTEDLQLQTSELGKTGLAAIDQAYVQSFVAAGREIEDLGKKLNELNQERTKALSKGIDTTDLDAKITRTLNAIKDLKAAQEELATGQYIDSVKKLLPSLEDYNNRIAEQTMLEENRKRGLDGLTEVQKLNLRIEMLGLDALALTNAALAEQIRLLRERAKALDDASEGDKPFGESFKDKIKGYTDSVKDLGGALGNIAVNALTNLEDRLLEFVTTGKMKFKEFVASVLSDLAKLAIRLAIVNTIKAIFPNAGFANGGIMTANGPVPLKKYARGGIANSPQLALFGEGSKPEAYVPLPDGRRIPVAMEGGGGTSVVVNVDAKGTSAQGDSGRGEQLGRAISQAVQAELIKQRRPGGLLAA